MIAATASEPYGSSMAAAIIRLLALVALMLMPLGMSAPAMTQSAPAPHAMAPAGHCDEQPEPDKSPKPQPGCTAMCTAIPAAEAPALADIVKPVAPRSVSISVPFIGVEPEIATPPPRHG
jgi:hypothetical protein